MNNQYHSHSVFGPTSYDDGHIHHYGSVSRVAPTGVPHTHAVNNVTTYNDSHAHHYMFETGPAIQAEGGHYHEYHSITEYVDGHIHHLRGYSSID